MINRVRFQNEGYVSCRSGFYYALDLLNGDVDYVFSHGINKLRGEIDSGCWAASYLLSMYTCRREDFVFLG